PTTDSNALVTFPKLQQPCPELKKYNVEAGDRPFLSTSPPTSTCRGEAGQEHIKNGRPWGNMDLIVRDENEDVELDNDNEHDDDEINEAGAHGNSSNT
ncbi:hypothetical protein Ancab_005930, partial [Ancistrocladus abbreviatus]